MISKSDIDQMSPLVLAYMGDAVYEKFIREYVIRQGLCKNGLLHKKSIKFVSAKAQAKIVHYLEDNDLLTDEEKDIVRRGRNSNPHSTAKNADIIDYKYATGFEALIGWLYLHEKHERLEEILDKCIKERSNLDHTNKEMMSLAYMSNEKINEAREQLEKITADKDLMNILMREEIKEMDENIKLHNVTEAGKKIGIEEGKKEGIKEGQQEEKVKIAK